ncbi:MAG: hypothetical protein A2498_15865 [Lentisphaerae bacterium RIFOXYC12_FULL_60_16]|nr:MAG: hypothetical protein A2498_15865 [Lentisphaerae bacterium RIFOXYC12_FULL_60_16]OGV73915.1 MAG: hypothetical protein A2269_04160 [Lentisphaerae bacterium RIFOXYA12_FULL_60_10]OGV79148.1 MAG: hypothetical protein A2340_03425 [Lentisphaerae bacterium RIFOXYB12_FULL_60_10]
MNLALELTGVTKSYGRRKALDGLNLRVPAGSLFGLVGSNGAGKTTAMSVVSGIVQPDGGVVDLLESGAFDPVRHAGRVTVLPQDALLPRESRVREILGFYAELQGVPPADIGPMVGRLLQTVHLADRADSAIRTLSHGMARRVTLVQAFLGDPDLVLLDEPMSGLDPREAQNARHFLASRRAGQTVVISSHNLHEIERMCDRVAVVEKGRTLLQDTMDGITGRRHVIRYRLMPASWDLAKLEARLPDMILERSPSGDALECRYRGDLATVNAVILGFLLESKVGVLQVYPGDELEHAYLNSTGVPVQPGA